MNSGKTYPYYNRSQQIIHKKGLGSWKRKQQVAKGYGLNWRRMGSTQSWSGINRRGMDRRRKLTLIVVTELELCCGVCFGFDEVYLLSPEVGRFSRMVFD